MPCFFVFTRVSLVLFAFLLSTQSLSLAQYTVEPNQPPRITAVNFVNPQINTTVDIVIALSVEDPEDNVISTSYQWFVNGAEVTGNSSETLPASQFKRGDKVSFKATPSDNDSTGTAFTSKEFEIPNAPPQLLSNNGPTFGTDEITYQVQAQDPDGDPLTFQLSGQPRGMTIDSQSGQLHWIRQPETKGEYTVSIIISDDHDGQTTASFSLTLK